MRVSPFQVQGKIDSSLNFWKLLTKLVQIFKSWCRRVKVSTASSVATMSDSSVGWKRNKSIPCSCFWCSSSGSLLTFKIIIISKRQFHLQKVKLLAFIWTYILRLVTECVCNPCELCDLLAEVWPVWCLVQLFHSWHKIFGTYTGKWFSVAVLVSVEKNFHVQ